MQVASFGAHLMKKDVITMSVAPRDSFKAQIQFALERGLPAFVGMLATQRLPLPSMSFDLIHCSRCLVPFAAPSESYLSVLPSWKAGHLTCIEGLFFFFIPFILSVCVLHLGHVSQI